MSSCVGNACINEGMLLLLRNDKGDRLTSVMAKKRTLVQP